MSRRGRARDKWRLKKWYVVKASTAFGEVELGRIPADDPSKLYGRVVESSLSDLTGDFSLLHVKLYFQIVKVEDSRCETVFKGHDLTRDYLRSLIRRGSSRIDGIFKVTTKDGYVLRVSAIALTRHRTKTSQERAIRKIMGEIITSKAEELNFDEFIQQAVLGKIASEIYNEAKKIYPLRKVEVRKSKLLSMPQNN
ncbi:MAG: 30S ribosomal protein S3ae [archaeon GB-1867-097]|nr:30S ribosomal protein S3ae [Candidatus Verstraetearchaeota archaeon]MCS7373500.1 30S ribosomal protein S3ae [Candidatus Culexmicrobium thermophilum]MCS7384703.1 30S ribosomal protein S3ae [Candidatus Culexmicrobium thermophilum]RLE55541.1 MAG: 30S ribosomal protein S3ae [Candidatus Verstraetearchaeota archaeon]HDO21167.1 30S ribosomal protein S3ae [Candidatus Bathyarchaeota archaeon]